MPGLTRQVRTGPASSMWAICTETSRAAGASEISGPSRARLGRFTWPHPGPSSLEACRVILLSQITQALGPHRRRCAKGSPCSLHPGPLNPPSPLLFTSPLSPHTPQDPTADASAPRVRRAQLQGPLHHKASRDGQPGHHPVCKPRRLRPAHPGRCVSVPSMLRPSGSAPFAPSATPREVTKRRPPLCPSCLPSLPFLPNRHNIDLSRSFQPLPSSPRPLLPSSPVGTTSTSTATFRTS
jgi:hypothetical protein